MSVSPQVIIYDKIMAEIRFSQTDLWNARICCSSPTFPGNAHTHTMQQIKINDRQRAFHLLLIIRKRCVLALNHRMIDRQRKKVMAHAIKSNKIRNLYSTRWCWLINQSSGGYLHWPDKLLLYKARQVCIVLHKELKSSKNTLFWRSPSVVR